MQNTLPCEQECAICLQAISVGTAIKLPCTHIFHRCCYKTSLSYSLKCPLCRSVCFNIICVSIQKIGRHNTRLRRRTMEKLLRCQNSLLFVPFRVHNFGRRAGMIITFLSSVSATDARVRMKLLELRSIIDEEGLQGENSVSFMDDEVTISSYLSFLSSTTSTIPLTMRTSLISGV